MSYRVTYEVDGVEGTYPSVSPSKAAQLARQHRDAGHEPVKIFDHGGGRIDLHTLELAVHGTSMG